MARSFLWSAYSKWGQRVVCASDVTMDARNEDQHTIVSFVSAEGVWGSDFHVWMPVLYSEYRCNVRVYLSATNDIEKFWCLSSPGYKHHPQTLVSILLSVVRTDVNQTSSVKLLKHSNNPEITWRESITWNL